MNSYKGVTYWWNDLQHKFMAQVGYEIVATATTEQGIKTAITRHLK